MAARKETNFKGIEDGQIVGDVSISGLVKLLGTSPHVLAREINDNQLPFENVRRKISKDQAREIVVWWSNRNQ